MSEKKQKSENMKKTMAKLWKLLMNHRKSIIFVMIASVIATILTTVSPVLLGSATNQIVKGIKNYQAGVGGVDMPVMGKILTSMLLCYIGAASLKYLQQFVLAGMTQKIIYGLRKDIQHKISRLSLQYFDTNTLGDVLSRVTNDVEVVVYSLQSSLPDLFTSILTLVFVLIGMLLVSPILTLVALITFPISIFASLLVVRFSQKYFRGQQKGLGEVGGYVEEMFTGHEVIRAFGKEEDVIEEFNHINTRLYKNAKKAQFASSFVVPLSSFFSNIGYVASAVIGGFMSVTSGFPIGSIQTFILYLRQFNQPVAQISGMITDFQEGIAAAERVFEFLEEKEEEPNPKDYKTIELPVGQVSMKHVRFGYSPEEPLIQDLTIDFKAGDKVAIVGPTGAGKTTLVNLLLRFYDVQGGKITIDGVDIMEMRREDLRSLFGMVLQDTWLFHGTIEENIRYGRLNATTEEVHEAAKNAFVDEFIRSQPGGYQMMIAEDAENLSGGEKQLLTIARAILSDPIILILDEATSSVDTRTELLIQKAMANLMENRTSFVIAHRLSTIRDAEMILVLNDGDIVEVGNHENLLEKNGFYANLYRSQLAGNSI